MEGISFTIKGDNFNKTVKTGKDGSVSVEGLFPGTYTVTEQSIDRYEPQKTQTVTLIGGKTSTVTFSNTLKRGSLEIVKTSEDNLVEGMKFHLYGTSLSGLPVDEYAVTDKNGLAKFENVLISGDTPYVVEEVDTAVRYVVPASQTAPIEWNKVTKRSFDNVLKKFQVTVTKTDAETGSPQGDASLAGAVYGIYKGEELIDTYTTDENGQFTTKYYICDNDWTVREISPSEGYLLDTAIHKVGAEPELYTVELNSTANDVNEQVIKGNIALIKHTVSRACREPPCSKNESHGRESLSALCQRIERCLWTKKNAPIRTMKSLRAVLSGVQSLSSVTIPTHPTLMCVGTAREAQIISGVITRMSLMMHGKS